MSDQIFSLQGSTFEPLSEEEVRRRKEAADIKTKLAMEKLNRRKEKKRQHAGMCVAGNFTLGHRIYTQFVIVLEVTCKVSAFVPKEATTTIESTRPPGLLFLISSVHAQLNSIIYDLQM